MAMLPKVYLRQAFGMPGHLAFSRWAFLSRKTPLVWLGAPASGSNCTNYTSSHLPRTTLADQMDCPWCGMDTIVSSFTTEMTKSTGTPFLESTTFLLVLKVRVQTRQLRIA